MRAVGRGLLALLLAGRRLACAQPLLRPRPRQPAPKLRAVSARAAEGSLPRGRWLGVKARAGRCVGKRAAPLCPFCSWVAKSGPCLRLPLGVVVAGALPGGGREERMEQGGGCSPHAHAGHAVACSFFTHQSGDARGEDSHRTAPAPRFNVFRITLMAPDPHVLSFPRAHPTLRYTLAGVSPRCGRPAG